MPQEAFSFLSNHIPSLLSGVYEVQTELTVKAPENAGFKSDPFYFFVGSERFQIPPHQVFAVFPPADSNGEYIHVLPHIELNRSTLPWERSTGSKDGQLASIPWLSVLLFEHSELEDDSKALIEKRPGREIRDLIGIPAEPGEDEKQEDDNQQSPIQSLLTLLRVKREFLNQILPTEEELPYLAHVRTGTSDTKSSFERAIIVSNRLPESGKKYHAHLVSLEGRFAGNSDYELTKGKGDKDGFLPILSLYSWSFSCPDNEFYKIDEASINLVPSQFHDSLRQFYLQEGKKEKIFESKGAFEAKIKESGFPSTNEFLSQHLPLFKYEKATLKALLTHLQTDTFVFGEFPDAPAHVQDMLAMGSIPMLHTLRNGSKTVSWYRSPFVPLEAKLPVPNFVKGESSPDFYLLYNPDTDMLDVTYASAWELGRLMMISSPLMAQKMHEWKLSQAQKERYEEQKNNSRYLNLATPHFSADSGSELSLLLKGHYESLALLNTIPYHYLVPDGKYLPEESIRMFKVDSAWISSLLEGAYSIGGKVNLALPWLFEKCSTMYGVLLRSEVVDGFPSLNLEPFSGEGTEKPVLLRKDRLGSGVLLCLFDKLFDRLDVYLPAESLHFGFENPTHGRSDYYKNLKDVSKKIQELPLVSHDISWRDKSLRVINPKSIAEKFGIKTSSEFSIQMLQGETKVAFLSDSSKWNKGLLNIIMGG